MKRIVLALIIASTFGWLFLCRSPYVPQIDIVNTKIVAENPRVVVLYNCTHSHSKTGFQIMSSMQDALALLKTVPSLPTSDLGAIRFSVLFCNSTAGLTNQLLELYTCLALYYQFAPLGLRYIYGPTLPARVTADSLGMYNPDQPMHLLKDLFDIDDIERLVGTLMDPRDMPTPPPTENVKPKPIFLDPHLCAVAPAPSVKPLFGWINFKALDHSIHRFASVITSSACFNAPEPCIYQLKDAATPPLQHTAFYMGINFCHWGPATHQEDMPLYRFMTNVVRPSATIKYLTESFVGGCDLSASVGIHFRGVGTVYIRPGAPVVQTEYDKAIAVGLAMLPDRANDESCIFIQGSGLPPRSTKTVSTGRVSIRNTGFFFRDSVSDLQSMYIGYLVFRQVSLYISTVGTSMFDSMVLEQRLQNFGTTTACSTNNDPRQRLPFPDVKFDRKCTK